VLNQASGFATHVIDGTCPVLSEERLLSSPKITTRSNLPAGSLAPKNLLPGHNPLYQF
jgi:hypothetical protein